MQSLGLLGLVFDAILNVTPLMGHLWCLISHWSVPVLKFLCLFTLFYIQAPSCWFKYSGRGSPSANTRTALTTGLEPTPGGLCYFLTVSFSFSVSYLLLPLFYIHRPHGVGSSIVIEVVQVPILGLLRPLDWNSRGPVLFFLGFLAFNFKLLSFFLSYSFETAPWFFKLRSKSNG